MNLQFLKVKTVPTLFWSSPVVFTVRPPAVSAVFLIIGLMLFGLGESFLVAAGIGVSPWTVFAQGLMVQTGWSIGTATAVLSFAVLALWIPLRQSPGIGTVANAIIIALVLEFAVPLLPVVDAFAGKLAYSVAGILVTGIGGAIYLIANLGPGPRDGLMTGLQRVTQFPIAHVRSAIEVSVVVLGVLLGGTFGIGTILFAFGIGPAMALGLHLCALACGASTKSSA